MKELVKANMMKLSQIHFLEAIKKMQEMGFGVTKVKQGDIVTPINTFLNLWSHLNKKPDFPELEIPKRKPDFPEPDYPDLDF